MLYPHTIPKSGFTGYGNASGFRDLDPATSHNKAATDPNAKIYPLGTIIGYFNATIGGYGACAYLSCTEASSDAIIAGDLLTMTAGSHTDVTNDAAAGACPDVDGGGLPACIAITAMTSTYRGWFWINGVCPDLYTAASTLLSATTVTATSTIEAMEAFRADEGTDGLLFEHKEDDTDDAGAVGMVLADCNTTVALASVRLFGIGWGI